MSRTTRRKPRPPEHLDRAGLRDQLHAGLRHAARTVRVLALRGADFDDVLLPLTRHEVSNPWGWD